MECPKCGRKAVTSVEICFFCGHNINEQYMPEVHNKGSAAFVEEPKRLFEAEKSRLISTASKTARTTIVKTVVLSVVLVILVVLLSSIGGIYKKYMGPPELDTQIEWAAYEISLIQKAQNRSMRDIQRFMNFQQLADAGYLSELNMESVEPNRILTAHATFELATANPESTYLMYIDTQDGSRSWTIDQDSKDQYQEISKNLT